MKSLLRIFLLLAGIFSPNLVKAQIITINTHGRVEKKTTQDLSIDKPGAEISLSGINEKSVDTIACSIPIISRRFYAPLKNIAATSGYGWRKHPVTGDRKFHAGIDLEAWHEPVYAVADGIVKKAGWKDVEGYYVVLDQGGVETIYCHLNKLLCNPGDTLKGGAMLGISGNTGRSTDPHLHFGIKSNYVSIDPIKLLKAIDFK
jgi:murein DD-endopeptidase MepM/ murein hydrolase activator NlpD